MIAGVGRDAPRPLTALEQDRPGELVFAEALWGDRYALDADERVLRYDAGADERALAGSSFGRWLDATIAREQILFGPDGEYAPDVFDPSGQEVTPAIALRQAERALKIDPGAADVEHARGIALVRLGRQDAALAAFRTASELDAGNPWPLFDLGRTALALDTPAAALPAFRQAAAATREDATAARLLAWAVRAAVAAGDGGAAALRAEALARDPRLIEGLTRAASAAGEDADDEARAEEIALLEAVAPGTRCRAGCPSFLTRRPLSLTLPRFAGRGDRFELPLPLAGEGRGEGRGQRMADSPTATKSPASSSPRSTAATFFVPAGTVTRTPAAAGWIVARDLRTPAPSSAKTRTSPFRTLPRPPTTDTSAAPAVPVSMRISARNRWLISPAP